MKHALEIGPKDQRFVGIVCGAVASYWRPFLVGTGESHGQRIYPTARIPTRLRPIHDMSGKWRHKMLVHTAGKWQSEELGAEMNIVLMSFSTSPGRVQAKSRHISYGFTLDELGKFVELAEVMFDDAVAWKAEILNGVRHLFPKSPGHYILNPFDPNRPAFIALADWEKAIPPELRLSVTPLPGRSR